MLVYVTIVERGRSELSYRELRALLAELPGVGFHVGDAVRAWPRAGVCLQSGAQQPGAQQPGARPGARPCVRPGGESDVRIDIGPARSRAVTPAPEIAIDADAFWAADFDTYELDRACDELAGQGAFGLRLEGHGLCVAAVDAVVTRHQRFAALRNPASAEPVFDDVLACHRGLHDCRKPLVRADFDHALDTWQWLLRLDPCAGLAVQIAALFHDVERLVSEADARIEHHASDYRAFKRAHARRGGDMTRAALASTGLPPAIIERAADLVSGHEQPGDQAERLLLNEADALSFFSLNSTGFLRYYGAEHTRRKIAYTLARLRPSVWWRLGRIRYDPVVADMLHETGITTYRRHMSHGERDGCKSA
jgi:hypothetical protein